MSIPCAMDGQGKSTELREWLERNGGYLQDTIDITYCEADGYHLRALRDIDNSIALIHIPQSLTLSIATFHSAKSHWPKRFTTDYLAKPYVVTRFLLMDEYLQYSDSWWYPYIALLPQPKNGTCSPPFNTPLWFSEEDMGWLHGTGLQKATKQMRNLWQAEYNGGVKYLDQLPNYGRFTWPLYLWAATVISSRCFPSDKYSTRQDSLPQNDGEKGQVTAVKTTTYPVLVPVLDLANHDPQVMMDCCIDQDGYSLFVAAKVASTEQIYITYGEKSNEELFMGYGFVIQDNLADTLGLTFPLLDTPRKWCMEQAIAEGKHFPLSADYSRQSLEGTVQIGSIRADSVFYLRIGMLPPASLLDTIRLNIANERELKDFYNEKDQSARRSLVQAYAQLALALLHRVTLLSTSPAVSDQTTSTTENQRIARRYALGQRQILVHHTQKLFSDLDRVRQSPVVWSLRNLLNSSNSHPIKNAIRKLCRAVCATRNVVKLKSQGLEDSIMTIFVCLVWLAMPRDQQGLHQPESVARNEIHVMLHHWCSFLDATYCPPPGKDMPCTGVNCLCSSYSPHPWTLPEFEHGNSATVDVAAVAHTIVHRAYLLGEIDSLFGEAGTWSEKFLQWGCGVWTAEAVLIPILMGDNADDVLDIRTVDDAKTEKALYLERLPSNATAR